MLDHWKITVLFEPREKHAAHCWVDSRGSAFDILYVECEIYLNPAKVPETQPDLDAFILHELAAHPAFWPLGAVAVTMAGSNKRLQRLVEHAEENTAVILERILMAAFGLRGAT